MRAANPTLTTFGFPDKMSMIDFSSAVRPASKSPTDQVQHWRDDNAGQGCESEQSCEVDAGHVAHRLRADHPSDHCDEHDYRMLNGENHKRRKSEAQQNSTDREKRRRKEQ